MITFSFMRYDRQIKAIGNSIGLQFRLIDNDVEKSWEVFATRIIDALEEWCHSSGIKAYGMGHTQIAINITFAEPQDAMMFKLRWHSCPSGPLEST